MGCGQQRPDVADTTVAKTRDRLVHASIFGDDMANPLASQLIRQGRERRVQIVDVAQRRDTEASRRLLAGTPAPGVFARDVTVWCARVDDKDRQASGGRVARNVLGREAAAVEKQHMAVAAECRGGL